MPSLPGVHHAARLKLMCVLAHPDDESLGTGGILAKYAAEGIETSLITATLGERGWLGDEAEYPGAGVLGNIRKAELHEAARVLGLREVILLGYMDGELDQADTAEVVGKIAGHIRRVRPQVIVTFDPLGAYGHPDHIAISQFTVAAIVAAAGTDNHIQNDPPHTVSKLYFIVDAPEYRAIYEEAFGDLTIWVDGEERRSHDWYNWAITTRIDTAAYWQQVWQAVECHRTQLRDLAQLKALPETSRLKLWSEQALYRCSASSTADAW